MAGRRTLLILAAGLLSLSSGLMGCESTETDKSATGSIYYGTGLSDPWYHGDYYYPPDTVVTPPTDRPPQPTHPIYTPPGPTVNPLPSMPSTPRPALRR
jgi:hypothetical protein